MVKVVIDTNVFISGILFGGNPGKVLKLWIKNDFVLCISPQLQAEIINKLQLKFQAEKDFTNNLLNLLHANTEKYIPHKKIFLVRDSNDNFLLELAEEAQADFIITGDKDLLTIQEYKTTRIISPKDFLNRVVT